MTTALDALPVEPQWAGLPGDLAERLGEWREATFRRTLRIVMDGYRTSAHDGAAGP